MTEIHDTNRPEMENTKVFISLQVFLPTRNTKLDFFREGQQPFLVYIFVGELRKRNTAAMSHFSYP